MKPKVLLSEDIHPAGKSLIEDQFELLIAPDTSEETLLNMVSDVFGIILRATTNVNEKVIRKAENLKVIARTGVGVDNVDIDAASKKNIYVCYTPGMNDHTVAEQTVAMILALSKQIIHMDHSVRDEKWNERFSEKQFELKGKTLGIIGLGAIGYRVSEKCSKGLEMRILAYDPFFKAKPRDEQIMITDRIDDVFIQSDFVSLHVPNTPENKMLVDNRLLSLMKPTAYFVNTARGGLVDEKALIEILLKGKIAGAALDVFVEEPLPANHPFVKMKQVVLSPHVAGSTLDSNVRIAKSAAMAILDVFEGRQPECVYNISLLDMNKN